MDAELSQDEENQRREREHDGKQDVFVRRLAQSEGAKEGLGSGKEGEGEGKQKGDDNVDVLAPSLAARLPVRPHDEKRSDDEREQNRRRDVVN